MGVPSEIIRTALEGFGSSFEQTPGRLNTFDGHPFRVVLDYAHNAHSLTLLARFVSGLPVRGRRIFVFGMAGDRRDEDIADATSVVAGAFDHFVVREDCDRRGRDDGEVAALIERCLHREHVSAERVEVILDEMSALDHALSIARPGDLVVITGVHIEDSWAKINSFQPQPRRAQRAQAAG
jgi:cyanophycin synthetase